MNARAPAIAALLGLAAAGCSDPPPPRYATEADLRFLGEGRATEIIAEVLGEANVQATSGWTIDIGPEHRFDVDVRAGQTKFGLEWVTAQDRVDWGDAIPQPNETGQLQTLAGQGNDADAEILVLDERTFRYDPDRARVERGSRGVREAEGRLRRDVSDFVEHMRAQGAI